VREPAGGRDQPAGPEPSEAHQAGTRALRARPGAKRLRAPGLRVPAADALSRSGTSPHFSPTREDVRRFVANFRAGCGSARAGGLAVSRARRSAGCAKGCEKRGASDKAVRNAGVGGTRASRRARSRSRGAQRRGEGGARSLIAFLDRRRGARSNAAGSRRGGGLVRPSTTAFRAAERRSRERSSSSGAREGPISSRRSWSL